MTPSTPSTGQDRAAPLTPDALDAIRERDAEAERIFFAFEAEPEDVYDHAMRDRRVLLAELDRRSGAALDVARLAKALDIHWERKFGAVSTVYWRTYLDSAADIAAEYDRLAASPQDPEPGTEREPERG